MGKVPKPFPLDEETIEFPSFKAELSEIDIAKLTPRGTGIVVIPFGPIELAQSQQDGRAGRDKYNAHLAFDCPNRCQSPIR